MHAGLRRLIRLEDKIDLKGLLRREEEARKQDEAHDKILKQFCALLDEAVPLLSEADQARVLPPDDGTPTGSDWPLRRWLDSLLDGSSQLPDGLAPETVRALLAALLQPKQTSYHRVCLGCGLSRPHLDTRGLPWKVLPGKVPCQGPPPWYDVPDFFPACPHCGSDQSTWAHLNRPDRRGTYPAQEYTKGILR
jgi:hypothetical protein